MLLTLEIGSGLSTGRKIWLRSNELAQVGRTEWTDLAVTTDEQLADVHFAVFVNCTECRIRDLQSPTGTFVNGTQVRECVIHDGDAIRAGSTQFQVTIQGEQPQEAKTEPDRADRAFHYRSERCAADFPVYVGEEGAPSASALAGCVAQHMSVYALMRFGGSHPHLPAGLAGSRDYVTVTPNPAWYRFFPLLVAVNEFDGYAKLIDQGWDDEAVVCVVATDQPKQEVLAHLRNHAASFSGADVLREQLNCCPAGFLGGVLDGLSAVMLKDPETGSWRLYLNGNAGVSWQDLGFACPPHNEAGTQLELVGSA